MTTPQFLLYGWHWDPFALGLCAVLLVGMVWAGRRRQQALGTRERFCGISALAVLVLAMVSPLGTLARSYLFSAHMLQHLLLLLVIPPLFLLSLPKSPVGRICNPSNRPRTDYKSVLPGSRENHTPAFPISGSSLSWLAGVGAMWFWHVPVFCNAATSSTPVYWLQTISLLVLGGVFWWPIAGPRAHLSPLAGIGYLVSACLACTLLGIYITFAPLSVCSIYTHPVDRLGILPLIQQRWGVSPTLDQHIGGLLMWVPACLIYLIGVVGLLVRWFSTAELEGSIHYPVAGHEKGHADA